MLLLLKSSTVLDASEYIVAAALWVMVICSLACAGYMALLLREGYGPHERKLQRGALVFFMLFAGIFTAGVLYRWFPRIYVILTPIVGVCLSCSWMVFYYIVFTLTTKRRYRRFPRIYIILPLIMPIVIAAWMSFVPFEVPLGIVRNFRETNAEWPLFSRSYTSLMPSFLLFAGGCLSLSLVRLGRFHRSLSKRKRESARYRLRWIYTAVILILTAWIFGITAMIVSPRAIYSIVWFVALVAVVITAMEITLLYNLQRHNYPPLDIKPKRKHIGTMPEVSAGDESRQPVTAPYRMVPVQLSRKGFDDYLNKEKPYLDQNVTLTFMAEEIGAGRGELSKFVNGTYGMGFSQLIGQWRLKEFDSLRKTDKHKDTPATLLIRHAGFASYNSYLRARRAAEGVEPVGNQQQDENQSNKG